jgi:hypothetical protein
VSGVIVHRARGIYPDHIANIKTGRSLSSCVQAQKPRNMVALVLGPVTERKEGNSKNNKIDLFSPRDRSFLRTCRTGLRTKDILRVPWFKQQVRLSSFDMGLTARRGGPFVYLT